MSLILDPTNYLSQSFRGDGCVPNSHLPVIVYYSGLRFSCQTRLNDAKQAIAHLADGNCWYLDWVDSVYRRMHYHSTAHEALFVFRGNAHLQLGGKSGVTILVLPGTIVIIPAGVGHERIDSSRNFTVLGLYPENQKWDLQWGWRKNYRSSQRRIKKVPLPWTDPIFGKYGKLLKEWKSMK